MSFVNDDRDVCPACKAVHNYLHTSGRVPASHNADAALREAVEALEDYNDAVSELIATMNQEGDKGVKHSAELGRVFHLQNETQDKHADLLERLSALRSPATGEV